MPSREVPQVATFVALLRGVNVGKANRVPMAELRALLSGLGYADVATLLNSGNAVFRATDGAPARHAADISAALAARLKVDVPVIVMSARDLAAVIAECPFEVEPSGHARLLVAFVQAPGALRALASIEELVVPPERFAIGPNAAYLLCAGGIAGSRAANVLLGRAGRIATTRNMATVLKLQALLAVAGGRRAPGPDRTADRAR
jgi:uncharacterized protein (DUF1697 family)